MLNETQTQCLHPLIYSLVHPEGQNCKGESLKDRSWQEAEKNVTSWKSGRDEPCSRSVCVYVSADCELIRCLLILYLSHLYFLTPFNPSTWISTHAVLLLNPFSHSGCKFLCTVLNIYFPFPRPLVSNLSFSIFRPALFLNLCSERPKMVSFALFICHSSLVPPFLKLFDSITIST